MKTPPLCALLLALLAGSATVHADDDPSALICNYSQGRTVRFSLSDSPEGLSNALVTGAGFFKGSRYGGWILGAMGTRTQGSLEISFSESSGNEIHFVSESASADRYTGTLTLKIVEIPGNQVTNWNARQSGEYRNTVCRFTPGT